MSYTPLAAVLICAGLYLFLLNGGVFGDIKSEAADDSNQPKKENAS